MSEDIVVRLRDRREYQARGHGEVVDVPDGDCDEAADTIEALRGEVERLNSLREFKQNLTALGRVDLNVQVHLRKGDLNND